MVLAQALKLLRYLWQCQQSWSQRRDSAMELSSVMEPWKRLDLLTRVWILVLHLVVCLTMKEILNHLYPRIEVEVQFSALLWDGVNTLYSVGKSVLMREPWPLAVPALPVEYLLHEKQPSRTWQVSWC